VSEQTPNGRWRVFDYAELLKRDKVTWTFFWLRDKSLEESDDCPNLTYWPRKSPTKCRQRWSSFGDCGEAEGVNKSESRHGAAL